MHEYDARNRLVRSRGKSGKVVENTYNGEGLRVSKSVDGVTTRYLYEQDCVVLEQDGTGNQTARNVYGIRMLTRETSSWWGADVLLRNGQGDVTRVQSTRGTTMGRFHYDAFGTHTRTEGAAGNPYRYAGCRFDEETELYYLNARFYDSATARFLQEDTYRGEKGDQLSLNLYAYCRNNPLKYYDPSGHKVAGWDEPFEDYEARTGYGVGSGVGEGNEDWASDNDGSIQISAEEWHKNAVESTRQAQADGRLPSSSSSSAGKSSSSGWMSPETVAYNREMYALMDGIDAAKASGDKRTADVLRSVYV